MTDKETQDAISDIKNKLDSLKNWTFKINLNNTMGFGTTTTSDNYFIKIRGLKKWEDKVYFEVTKGEEKIEATFIEWNVVSIEPSSYEYEWTVRNTYKLTLEDADWKYTLDTAYTGVWRAILNCLWSAEKLGKVKISVYINKKGFKSVYVENNWESLKWSVSIDEQKTMIEEIKNKKWEVIQRDYAQLEEHFRDIVIPKVKANIWEAVVKEEVKEEVKKDMEIEELPF